MSAGLGTFGKISDSKRLYGPHVQLHFVEYVYITKPGEVT